MKNEDDKHDSSNDSLQSSFNKQTSIKSDEDQEAVRIQQKQKKNRKEKPSELQKLENLI